MTIFTPTRKDNPCQVCANTDGRCRTTEAVHLCMSAIDDYSSPPGLRFIGLTRDSAWGKWIVDNRQEWTEQQRKQWQQEQAATRSAKQQQETQRQEAALPPEQRDHYYRRLLRQLDLAPTDRADLQRRGLSDAQIKAASFRSVEQWQALPAGLPFTLPGVSLDERSLNTQPGYLCPLFDVDGQLIAFQVRLRSAEQGGRYRWLSSHTKKRPNGPTAHLPNGENPITVARPVDAPKLSEIGMCEGILKPFITAQKLGQVVVGAAGGQFASSPETLQETLERLSEELGTKTIAFYPDAGSTANKGILRQYRSAWNLLREWGYAVQIGWWGQTEKSAPDIDELTDYSQIQWLTVDQFEAIVQQQKEAGQTHSVIIDGIKALLAKGSRKLKQPQGFTRIAAASKVNEYAEGDRLATWKEAIAEEYRYILDQSGTGTEKSHDAGLAHPDQFDCEQFFYVTSEHRNPSTQTLAGWEDFEARHSGLVAEKTPNGSDRQRRAKRGEAPSIPGNCGRTSVIGILREKAIDGADSAGVVCAHCPLREACCNASGSGFGYLNERRNGLLSSRLRLHPASLPAPQTGSGDTEARYDYSSVGLLWDEPGASLQTMRSINVSLKDIEQLTLLLTAKTEHSKLLKALQPLLTALRQYLDGTISAGKFGLNHQQVLALLQAIAQDLRQAVSLGAIGAVVAPDLSFLNTVAAYGVELADLPVQMRKRFADRDTEAAEKAETSLVKQWLLELLSILSGDANGHLHLVRQQLTITLPDNRAREVVESAKFAIFLDATLTREDLALKLGCDPQAIFVCRQKVQTHSNLKVTQVHDLGRLGMQRGAEQQRRAAAIVAHYQALDATTKAIDFKRCADEGMGVWWRDSRGTNDFLSCTTLILTGTPCRNLASLQAEYGVLTGCYDLEATGFKAFVDRAILADYYQAIGRLRANRRPDEQLRVVIVSDFALDLPTEQVKGSDVCLEAAGKFERFQLAVKSAVESLKETGAKLTQTAIAGICGYSQQYIARHWQLLQTLMNNFDSICSKNADPPPGDLETVVELAIGYCQDSPQVLTAIQEIFFEWLEPSQRQQLWAKLTVLT